MLKVADDWRVQEDGISKLLIVSKVSSAPAISALGGICTVNSPFYKPDRSWLSSKIHDAPEIRLLQGELPRPYSPCSIQQRTASALPPNRPSSQSRESRLIGSSWVALEDYGARLSSRSGGVGAVEAPQVY